MPTLYGRSLTEEQYIEAWGQKCLERYYISKVLPSLPICQGILECGWGRTPLAMEHGNYHAMNWYGDSVTAKYPHFTMRAPQERDGQTIFQMEEFCEFENIDQELDCLYSWYDRNKPGYKKLHGETNAYNNFKWIKEAGYATSSAYTNSLTTIYNKYPLIRMFDVIALGTEGLMITGQEIADAAIAIYNDRDNKTYCQECTGQLAEADIVHRRYDYFRSKGGNTMTMDYGPWLEINRGKQCFDCNGFVCHLLGYSTSYYSTEAFKTMPQCPDKNNAPAGAALYLPGHVAISIGNGEFIDFYAYNNTCRKGKISEALFVSAHYIRGVDYTKPSSNPFVDVEKDDWFYNDVMYVYKKGIMTGLNDEIFAPDRNMERGMVVTALYRMAGEPEYNYRKIFSDVEDNLYYSKAVTWAYDAGVITGYNDGRFGPHDPVVRQDYILMLYRYAKGCHCKVDTVNPEAYKNVEDWMDISPYAIEAMNWGYSYGFIGVNSNFYPKDSILRCEIAAIIHRFMNYYTGA